mmetsp:Transcript_69147/g.162682  ORF Transcript_69147/g.162682 Transcript_69147/m.162682 type:complete len:262 (+) Transcript_69147:432-1217(+)
MALQHVQCVQVSSEDCFPVPKSLLCRRDHQDVFFDWILQTLAIPLGLMTVGSRQHVGALTHLRKSITEILFRLSEKLARWTEFSELGGGLTTLFYKLSGHLVHLGELILQLDNHVAHVLELFIIWIETFRCLHLVSVEVLSFFRDRLQHGTKLSLHPRLRCFQGPNFGFQECVEIFALRQNRMIGKPPQENLQGLSAVVDELLCKPLQVVELFFLWQWWNDAIRMFLLKSLPKPNKVIVATPNKEARFLKTRHARLGLDLV